MTTDTDIGLNVSRLRERAGLSQKQLADAMRAEGFKWSQATVWSAEQGNRAVRLAEAEVLANTLESNVDELLLRGIAVRVSERVRETEETLAELLELSRRFNLEQMWVTASIGNDKLDLPPELLEQMHALSLARVEVSA